MSAPTLVPATQSMGTPAFRSARMTPMWAIPRAKPPGQGEADARAVAGGAGLFFGEQLDFVGGVAQPVFGESDLFRDAVTSVGVVALVGIAVVLVVLVGHSEYSLVRLRRRVRLFDPGMLVL
jgi:hypothetical protein